jgi:hypothetical protein
VFELAEERGFIATVPKVPGAISEGKTIEEARAMVFDAVNEQTLARRKASFESTGAAARVESVRAVF